jgi:NAD(P)-dependent dehydrogenase (short-subunit alcohol dehydrogenase family)
VNAVALGVILPPPGEGEEYMNALAAEIPLQRAGGTDPVVETVLYLLRNDFVTGEIVRVDGGAHLV